MSGARNPVNSTAQQPAPNPFDAMLENFRQVVREEIAAALGSKNEKPAKLLFTTAEAAEMLGVPETWLAAQARSGAVPSVRMGHYVRFRLTDLQKFLEKPESE